MLALGILMSIPFIAYQLFRMHKVQSYLAGEITSYLSEELNTEIYIHGLDINFFLQIIAEKVYIKDLHDQTLLKSESIRIGLRRYSLRKRKAVINNIILHRSEIALRKNMQDTTLNLQFIIDYFSGEEKDKKPWEYTIRNIEIRDSEFRYEDRTHPKYQKITAENNPIIFQDIELHKLNLSIRDIRLMGDSNLFCIQRLDFVEKSGFRVENLRAGVQLDSAGVLMKNLYFQTNNSMFDLDLAFKFNHIKDFKDFINQVTIESDFGASTLYAGDLGFFAPSLMPYNHTVSFSGNVSGRIAGLRLRDFSVRYGRASFFKGDISLNGLPDIKETFMHIAVDQLTSNRNDIDQFVGQMNADTPSDFQLPDIMNSLGNINMTGYLTGFYNSFVSDALFRTNIGDIDTDISLTNNEQEQRIEYLGRVSANDFQLGEFLNSPETFGKIDFDLKLNGSNIHAADANFEVDGYIDSLIAKDYIYKRIEISGLFEQLKYTGKINLNDPNAKFDFDGSIDLKGDEPEFDFVASLDNVHLSQLHLIKDTADIVFSTDIIGAFNGMRIDDMLGSIIINNAEINHIEKDYTLNTLFLSTSRNMHGQKSLRLRSDFLDADISGFYDFSILGNSFKSFLNTFIPSLKDSGRIKQALVQQDFNFQVYLKHTRPLSELFFPQLILADDATLNGSFNSIGSKLFINAKSDSLSIGDNAITDWRFQGKTESGLLWVSSFADHLAFSDSLGIDSITFKSDLRNDSIQYILSWDNNILDRIKNDGFVKGSVSFLKRNRIKHVFNDLRFYLNDTVWTVSDNNYLLYDTMNVECSNIVFSNKSQSFGLNGHLSDDPLDKLSLTFRQFDLENFNILTHLLKVDIDGIVNGSVDILTFWDVPNFLSDLNVKDLKVNSELLGDASIETAWQNDDQSIYALIDVLYTGNTGNTVNPLHLEGYYYPYKKGDNINIDIALVNLNLDLVKPYIRSLISRIKGKADGRLNLSGNIARPELTGWMKLRTKSLVFDYLNAEYTFTDTVYFEKNAIAFRDFTIGDQDFQKAFINGAVSHDAFRNFSLDLQINMNAFNCLNTTYKDNELFYGKANASGLVRLRGPVDDISIDINARAEKGTSLVIPVSTGGEVAESSFITFVNKEEETEKEEILKPEVSGIHLDFDLEVTQDASVQILLEPQGELIASGRGNLQLEITKTGDFSMYGDYFVEQGTYLFKLQNLIRKRFVIEKGGKISWSGDPYDAQINMNAIYPVKAPLDDLPVFALDSVKSYNRRVPVDCKLHLQGELMNPGISFNIELPYSDDNTRQMFYSAIDTSNDLLMNKQVLSLLVLNRFTSEQRGFNISEGFGSTSYELLSSQLSSWLSKISDDFDIGVNYRQGDELTTDELEVALSTQLFNNRVLIDGNLGVGGEQNNPNAQNTSNIVGDVTVEVKLTDDGRFRVKAFNRANTTYYYEEYAPYTQGVGVFFRREFESFHDLFRSGKTLK